MHKFWALCALASMASTVFGLAPIKIITNGREVKTEQPPRMLEGKLYLPLRATAEAVGAKVDWQAKPRQVVVCKGKLCVPVTIGRGPGQGRLIAGRIFLPLRTFAQQMGLSVNWKHKQRVVIINQPPSPKPVPGLGGPPQ